MDWLVQYIAVIEWKNEFGLMVIPILIAIGVGILVLNQFKLNTKNLKGILRLRTKHSSIKKIIIENSNHEKLLNALKEMINCTIRSRSFVSRIHAEILNIDQLVMEKKTIKEQDLFVITQLYNAINNHREDFEKRIEKNRAQLPEKSLNLVITEQDLLLQIEQNVMWVIKSYKDVGFPKKYPELVDKMDLQCKEIIELYKKLTEYFQEELLEESKN
jgi:hypothetical protein